MTAKEAAEKILRECVFEHQAGIATKPVLAEQIIQQAIDEAFQAGRDKGNEDAAVNCLRHSERAVAAERERLLLAVRNETGECRCDAAYAERNRQDPNCPRHKKDANGRNNNRK